MGDFEVEERGRGGLGGEPGPFDLVKVEALEEEFPPVWVEGSLREKIRAVVAQRGGDDEFGGTVRGSSGAQPGGKLVPDERGLGGGEALQEALGDEAELDVAMVGGQLAADPGAVGGGPAVEKLVAVAAFERGHLLHPKMIRPGAEGVQ